MISIFVASLFGSVYARAPLITQSDVISRISIVFVAIIFSCVINLTSVLEVIATERAVFYREQAANMYRPIPYALSFTVAEIPYLIFSTLLFSVVFYFTVGLDSEPEKFWFFWIYYFLTIGIATFTGQLLASAAPNTETAASLGPLVLQLWNLFCGFLISPANIPNYWSFMYWLSPFHYCIEGYAATQFHGNNQIIQVATTKGQISMTVEAYASSYFGGEYKYSNRFGDIVALVAFLVALNILRALSLKYLRYINR
eukprot:c21384_g3_i2.p1 GENE.c21384_g3_i2~~c21384_g3_i2.p1  ORF type:complete len:256 (-),score=101.53 c21384_g3_i2:11-778(-)